MSTYGEETKTFLRIEVDLRRTCVDYTEPSDPTFAVRVNGLYAEITFRRGGRGWRWSATRWGTTTPWFHVEYGADSPFLVDRVVLADYPDDEHLAYIRSREGT